MFCYTYYSFIYFLIFLFLLGKKNIFRKVFNLLRTPFNKTLNDLFGQIFFQKKKIKIYIKTIKTRCNLQLEYSSPS